ncbi:uncharacterized protein LOC128878051 isoform X1 [Hylaeus volcanicus]|uniref:uncharacterized protein LOC128878051 isoform X1 n=1 Tax=Hylaeus volcanicus TaxID=313075 RepID=UPI0023B7F566|nr:uncharacterized protein LOC128878051 isoform X1 [Hylaeus volcanicus]
MHWLQAANIHEEMPLGQIRQNNSMNTNDSVNPSTTCPSPPNHNINLPFGHPYILNNNRGVPPSYEEAIDPNAPPPSYDTLFGRMREARRVSKGVFDFLKNIIILLLGTIGCTIIIGVTLVIPVCMIVIGGVYLNDCPQGEYIPIYLLVGGAFGVFKQLLHLLATGGRHHEEDEERIQQSHTQMLINCFMTVWFIIGSMWVYKEYEPNYDPAQGKYCNKTLYLFAFWQITSSYIFLGVLTAGVCSVGLVTILFQRP